MSATIETTIKAAIERRIKQDAQSVALVVTRLFDGFADGYRWLVLDRYASLGVAHFFPESDGAWSIKAYSDLCNALKKLTTYLQEQCGITSLIIKHHPHDPKKHKMMPPETVWGETPPQSMPLTEHHLTYDVRPHDSLFCGLYPDTTFLREKLFHTHAKKVINAFCFTGALGIAAARQEETQEILQVDSSPAALSWASANWDLNKQAFPHVSMRFLNDDCINFFEREVRRIARGAPYSDLIIIDPPSFGRGRKTVFSLKKDAETLIGLAAQCLSKTGTLIFTANYKIWSPEKMSTMVAEILSAHGHSALRPTLLHPPTVIFPSQVPESISVRGVWFDVGST